MTRNTIRFSRPLTDAEGELEIEVPVMREPQLFDIPAEYRLDVVETPPVLRSSTDAAYYPAPPFKESGVGREGGHQGLEEWPYYDWVNYKVRPTNCTVVSQMVGTRVTVRFDDGEYVSYDIDSPFFKDGIWWTYLQHPEHDKLKDYRNAGTNNVEDDYTYKFFM